MVASSPTCSGRCWPPASAPRPDARRPAMLKSSTHPRWFAVATAGLPGLLSDHLHCERKAAENALSLVRRYPGDTGAQLVLGRLAHEETSHVIQVAELMQRRGIPTRADSPNRYVRGLLAEVRAGEPQHHLDAL